jgi:NADPH2:quinone reductase
MFGYSSGAPIAFDAEDLFSHGIAVTAAIGPRMMSRPGGIIELARAAVAKLEAGEWRAVVHPPFPLRDAAGAHRALTDRITVGKVVLVP